MIFGDSVTPAGSVSPTSWLHDECDGESWTVGSLVPNRYEHCLQIHAPEQTDQHWYAEYRALHREIATIGARHTKTPEEAWFAIWEGYGFGTGTTNVVWFEPPTDEAERIARDQHRAQVRAESERQNAAIRAALDDIIRFDRPDRTHFLLTGPVRAVSDLHEPGSTGGWQRPDLWWPADRSWFVATDVDLWSLFVGGSSEFTDELAAAIPCSRVKLDDRLPNED